LDQFTILNRRVNSLNSACVEFERFEKADLEYFYTLDDGSSISVLSQLQLMANTDNFVEIGLSTGLVAYLTKGNRGVTIAAIGLSRRPIFHHTLG